MNDVEELKQQVAELRALVEALAKTSAYQQALMMQVLAHTEVAYSNLRALTSKASGESLATQSQRQENVYEKILLRIQRELELLRKSGAQIDLSKLLRFLDESDSQKN